MGIYHQTGGESVNLLQSRFGNMHPAVLLVYMLGLFSFGFMFSNPYFLIPVFAVSLSLLFYYSGFFRTLRLLKGYLLIALFVFLITPLTNHRGRVILFYLLDNPVTLEAIVYGFLTMLMILNMLAAFSMFNRLIDSERFLYLFSRFVPKTAFVTSMSLRFVQLFQRRGTMLLQVQKTRGNAIVGKHRIKKAGRLLSCLTSWTLEEGMQISQALKAKAYGTHRRTSYRVYRFVWPDALCIALLLVCYCALVYYKILGGGTYRVLRGLPIPGFQTGDCLALTALFCFLLMPFVIEAFTSLRRRLAY